MTELPGINAGGALSLTGGTCLSSYRWNAWIFPKVSDPSGYTMKYEYPVGALRKKGNAQGFWVAATVVAHNL